MKELIRHTEDYEQEANTNVTERACRCLIQGQIKMKIPPFVLKLREFRMFNTVFDTQDAE